MHAEGGPFFCGDFTKILHRFGKTMSSTMSTPTCFYLGCTGLRALTRALLHTPPTTVQPERPHLGALPPLYKLPRFLLPCPTSGNRKHVWKLVTSEHRRAGLGTGELPG